MVNIMFIRISSFRLKFCVCISVVIIVISMLVVVFRYGMKLIRLVIRLISRFSLRLISDRLLV